MSSIDTQFEDTQASQRGLHLTKQNLTLLIFTVTLFTSAMLLFSVQPLFTKMVLPRLGGSPAVWSIAMVFFQGVLLAGYAYAHALTKFTRPKVALTIHALVLMTAFLALPISISSEWGAPPESGQAFWLLGLFLVSVGLPFFAVAANGPLLQAWFSRTNHPHASDPYFLYGASNVGSFAALISYPIFFEPVFRLGTQAWLWSAGFALLGFLIITCGLITARSGVNKASVSASTNLNDAAPTLKERATWVALAFVPSALLVAVTQHISTDIAAAPFMWVIPLALFLLTFVITFQRKPILKHSWMSIALMMLVGPLIASLYIEVTGLYAVIGLTILQFVMFFVAAMVCHGELVSRRPSATHLTEFYLWMSFGGVLGGIFTGLVAPQIFSTVMEYPLLIAVVFLCRSELYKNLDRSIRLELLVVALVTAVLLLPAAWGFSFDAKSGNIYYIGIAMFVTFLLLNRDKPVRHLAVVVSMLVVGGFYDSSLGSAEYKRSFFGVQKVAESKDGQYRLLFSGTTLHGAERIRNEDGSKFVGKPIPTSYYYADSPMVQAIEAVRKVRGGRINVAAIGLGSGSLACYSKPGENWKFFEIDPVVVGIARDPSKFRFLSACAPDMPIEIGDARLTLANETNKTYDVIVLDAFSSDAIPVHLLTREAIALYLDKLTDNGVLVFHISNRHMQLAGVLSSIASTSNLVSYNLLKAPDKTEPGRRFDEASMVAVLARNKADLGEISTAGVWRNEPVDATIKPWTDDYANILSAIYRKYSVE